MPTERRVAVAHGRRGIVTTGHAHATDAALEVAAALQYNQARSDFLRRLAQSGVVLIDCEPRQLGVELVNRYSILKGAGSI